MRTWTAFRIVAALALAVGAARAHHPFSLTYDPAQFAALTGTVAAVAWSNPHVVVALDVASPDGSTERWMIEGLPPNTLRRRGVTQDLFGKGSRITVSGWHARDAALKIFHGRDVTFTDGTTRLFGETPTGGDRWHCTVPGCEAEKWIPAIP